MSQEDGTEGQPPGPAPGVPSEGRPGQETVTQPEQDDITLDLPAGLMAFAPGQVLGGRYRIHSQLGRGGMGEVWRAFDLKLRVEVALKALLPDLFKDERRRDLLRREVRAAREVMSPNVCRIFDLIEADGIELVSMEYIDGGTLLDMLRDRGPLDLKEAQDIASQFLAGLEAIHKAGLVHRDIKPENIMITRAGRVVVMDFGLARQEDSGAGTVSGTPAYMAPEQAAGLTVDARADVYAAGVVLAEMVSPEGIKTSDSRKSLWEGVRSEPVKLPDTPWAPVLKKAVAKEADNRYNSAHTLTRALEDVTLRVEGAEDITPYPGLASFTEENAEYFFGREAEVEQMWQKLEAAHLLAIVGPSGAGKSSFIGAGLVPHAPAGWTIVRCTPGNAAMSSLATVVAREMAGDADAVTLLPKFDDPDVAVDLLARWKRRSDHALLIVDQFEELFTQNSAEVQSRFTDLLGRLVLEADVRVLLSMRDDFLMQCKFYESLLPLFESLIPLMPPTGLALRRALVQPATKCGYRFEDDQLVEEMLTEVEGERGTLPLLAFAMARLWEQRDRNNGLLTRQAYKDVGGVGGALALHAEQTIDHIGRDRISIVRDLFRNLVTAEGTRAVREWDELLSVFDESKSLTSRASGASRVGRSTKPPVILSERSESKDPPKHGATSRKSAHSQPVGDPSTRSSDSLAQDDRRNAASEVLSELIDARLLTSYEIHEEDEEPTRRVEIIHESLLANWPRLVGWQTQDSDSARMRDELRQAARTWHEHQHSDDMLWTGSAYREFASWRERYPGGLSDLEQAFGDAMIAFAGRRRLRRRIAVAAIITALAIGLTLVGSFWQRSVREAKRAEAANLVALGQLELDSYPSATVAFSIASLDLTDTEAARQLALKALWKGPTAFVATEDNAWKSRFSPDGQRLLQARSSEDETGEGHLSIISADGSSQTLKRAHTDAETVYLSAITSTGHFVSSAWGADSTLENILWSLPEGRPLADIKYEKPTKSGFDLVRLSIKGDVTHSYPLGIAGDTGRSRHILLVLDNDRAVIDALGHDGSVKRIGSLDFQFSTAAEWERNTALDPKNGRRLAAVVDNEVLVFEIGDSKLSEPRRLGQFEGVVAGVSIDPLARFVATANDEGEIRVWSLNETFPPAVFQGPPDIRILSITTDGAHLEASVQEDGTWVSWVWDVSSSPPRLLRRIDLGRTGFGGWRWDTVGRQVAKWGPDLKVRIWSMDAPADAEPLVLDRGDIQQLHYVSFNPQGRCLVTTDLTGLALWPLARKYPVIMRRGDGALTSLVFAPDGSWLASSAIQGTVRLWPLKGEPPPPGHILHQDGDWFGLGLATSPDGKRILVGSHSWGVWILSPDGDPPRTLAGFDDQTWGVAISPDGRLAAAAGGGHDPAERVIRVWDMVTGDEVRILDVGVQPSVDNLHFTADEILLSASTSGLMRWNVETGEREFLYEGIILWFAVSTDGRQALMVETENASDLWGQVLLLDLDSGAVTRLDKFGDKVTSVALNSTGTIAVTGDQDGKIRLGPLTGEKPHLLLGHESTVWTLAFDPLGRWVASGSEDTTVRLWPMPDLSKPPLHTLPRVELINKLKTLTNVRIVRDANSSTGWKKSFDPFPGWETVPTW